jgi:hypothetical protein
MLVSFEEKFGPIDKWLLGVWEDAAASVKIFWLEFTTNGPAYVHAFFKNAEKFVVAFITNWREGLSWIWDSFWNGVSSLVIGIGKLGKALWATLKGDKADWDGVRFAFKEAMPDFADFAKRMNIEWDKPELVDLTAEKQKIRDAAAARKLQDAKSLDDANKMLTNTTANNLLGTADKAAEALTQAVEKATYKDAAAVVAGSYDAFKLGRIPGSIYGAGQAMGGAQLAAGGDSGSPAVQASVSVMPQMLTALNAILATLKGGDRDRTIIRERVEAIGVA